MTLPVIILEKHISGFSGIGGVLYQPFGVSQDYKLARFPPSMGFQVVFARRSYTICKNAHGAEKCFFQDQGLSSIHDMGLSCLLLSTKCVHA